MSNFDLSGCPYFNGTGHCTSGCIDEPECMTCEPQGGWPSERLRRMYEWFFGGAR